jgi:hypothetical protein
LGEKLLRFFLTYSSRPHKEEQVVSGESPFHFNTEMPNKHSQYKENSANVNVKYSTSAKFVEGEENWDR